MHHFSFLTFAFVGFGVSVFSTLFIHRDTATSPEYYDFSVPYFEFSEYSTASTAETEFLDITCATSDYCLSKLVGNSALLDADARRKKQSDNEPTLLIDNASLEFKKVN